MDGCDEKIDDLAGALRSARYLGRRVWVLGNGGSLAIAQHFAQDLLKMKGVRAHGPPDASVITAYSNDHAFEYAFFSSVRQLRDEHDLVIVFSCSGKSRNYIEFVSSRIRPLAAIVGTDGGFLAQKSDFCIHVKSQSYQVCESGFSVIADLLLARMEDA